MKTYLLTAGTRQAIGRAGDTDVYVAFNARTWAADYPSGTPQLMVTGPGGERTPVTVYMDGDLIKAMVPNELLIGPGLYSYVFCWVSGGTQVQSGICGCVVLGSNLAKEWENHKPAPDWAERIFLAAEVIEAGMDGTIEARNTAVDSAAAAAASQTAAGNSATAAAGSATAAAGSAATAAQKLEAVIENGAVQLAAIEAKGDEVLESIPDDYTALGTDAADLKNAVDMGKSVTPSRNVLSIENGTVANGAGTLSVTALDNLLTIGGTAVSTHTFEAAYAVNFCTFTVPENGDYMVEVYPEGDYAAEVDGSVKGAFYVTVFNGADAYSPATNVYLRQTNAAKKQFTLEKNTTYTLQLKVYNKAAAAAVCETFANVRFRAMIEAGTTASDAWVSPDPVVEVWTKYDGMYLEKGLYKNKFYGIDTVSGYLSSASAVSSNSDYKTTDYIDVSGYEYDVCVSPKIRQWAEYKADKSVNTDAEDSGYHNAQLKRAVLTPHENTKYIRFTYYASEESRIMLEDSEACSYWYEPPMMVSDGMVGLNDTQRIIAAYMAFLQSGTNPLAGKKWAACGDSFTAGDFSRSPVTGYRISGGRYDGQYKVYPYLIGERNNMDIQMLAVNGATIAMPETPGTFINAFTNTENTGQTIAGSSLVAHNYTEIAEDVDYVTLYYGINDKGHASGSSQDSEDTTGVIPLGTLSDETNTTFYGAWNVVMKWLRENRPKAHVGIIVTNGTGDANYPAAVREIAIKWGAPYIDLNGDERTPAMLRSSNPDLCADAKAALLAWQAVRPTADTTDPDHPIAANKHPNADAHEFESHVIEAFLKSL